MATVGGEYKELDAAAKKVRDTLIVRTQLMALPMGDKKKYEAVLKAAYGGRIDGEENSRLMQSYRKVIVFYLSLTFMVSYIKSLSSWRGLESSHRK